MVIAGGQLRGSELGLRTATAVKLLRSPHPVFSSQKIRQLHSPMPRARVAVAGGGAYGGLWVLDAPPFLMGGLRMLKAPGAKAC